MVHLAVVIPVYNERELLPLAIERLDATTPPGVERTLILVDDGSSDGTRALIRAMSSRPNMVTLLHDRNRGKGAAVRTGLAAARDAGADIAIIHDGDLEYDPADHARVIAPIVRGEADAVIGARFLYANSLARSPLHRAANHALTLASNQLTGLALSDMECCLKAFSREVLARLTIEEDRFGLEPEIVAKLARMKLDGGRPVRTAEVPVTYAGRGYAEGKKIGWRDGFAALWCIAKYSLREEACSTEAQETTEQTGRIGVEVVYVPLLREGTPVVRPTQAVPLGDGRFRVLATLNYDPDDETWEFPPGSIVRCRKETWSGNEVLVARERLVGP